VFPDILLPTAITLQSVKMEPNLCWKKMNSNDSVKNDAVKETPGLRFSQSFNIGGLNNGKQSLSRSKNWLKETRDPVERDKMDPAASHSGHITNSNSDVVSIEENSLADTASTKSNVFKKFNSANDNFGCETAGFLNSNYDDSSSTYSVVHIKKLDVRHIEDIDVKELESSDIEDLSIYE